MDPIQISPATPQDTKLIHALILELARYERLEHEVSATESDTHELLFGARPYAEAVVARYQGEAVGFALFFHHVSTFAGKPGLYLEDLYVREAYRRRGIGTAVLRYLARLAIARGWRRMEWTALDWNQPALNLYELMGAQARQDWVILRLEGEALQQWAGKP